MRVCTGVVVATITELLDHADTSTLVLIAVAKDSALLVKACVNGVRRAVPVIPEMAAEVNFSVVASRVAENEGLLLDTANADMEGLVPSAVLVKAVSATVEGSEVSAFATPAGLDADGDVLLDSAGAVMLVGRGAVVARIPVAIGAGVCERVPTVVADANDDASLLKTFANEVGMTVPVVLELLEHDNTRVAAARVEGSEVLRLEDPAEAGVRAGTGVVVAMIPALLDHVVAGTLVPIAVAKDDASLLKTCVYGTGVMPEMAAYVNTSGVDSLVAKNEVLLLELAANTDVGGLVPSAVLADAVSAIVEGSEGSVFDMLAVLEVDGDEIGADELPDLVRAVVRAGTSFFVAKIPVLLDHVDASTLVPIAVAKNDALSPKACVNGARRAVSGIPEMPANVVFSVFEHIQLPAKILDHFLKQHQSIMFCVFRRGGFLNLTKHNKSRKLQTPKKNSNRNIDRGALADTVNRMGHPYGGVWAGFPPGSRLTIIISNLGSMQTHSPSQSEEFIQVEECIYLYESAN